MVNKIESLKIDFLFWICIIPENEAKNIHSENENICRKIGEYGVEL